MNVHVTLDRMHIVHLTMQRITHSKQNDTSSSLPYFQPHLQAERTSNSLMEVPEPPDTVANCRSSRYIDHSSHPSRSVPVIGVGEGVFQLANSGKYKHYTASSYYVFGPVSSDTAYPQLNPGGTRPVNSTRKYLEPECIAKVSMGAPNPLDTVAPFEQTTVSTYANSPTLHAYYQNVGGINTRLNEYRLACSDGCYDIIALTETWLDDRTFSNQVCGDNYEVFRTDRDEFNNTKSSGGGVLVAVHRRLKAQLIKESGWSCVEQVWVSIKLEGRKMYLCTIYIPPDRTRDVTLIDAHVQSVSTIASRALPADEIVVFGDFNLPNLKWQFGSGYFLYADPAHSTFHAGTNALLDGYSYNLLQQINSIRNENDRMLDLCFLSKPDEAPMLSVAPAPLVKSAPHHPPLHFTMNISLNSFSIVPTAVHYDFKSADFNSIIGVLLDIDWYEILDKDDVDAAVQTYTNIVSYLIDRHVPKKFIRSSTHQPWQTTDLRRLKTAKKAALRKYSKYRLQSLKQRYLQLNHQYKKSSKRCYSIYLCRIQRKFKSNPKSFWKYVDEQRKESGLPSSMFHDGHEVSDTREICSFFSAKFSSTFSKENLSLDQLLRATRNVPIQNSSLFRITVDNAMLESGISK
ncbi:uncharacterized protein LOC129761454 [Toxorhynchites rutilus septentrionalis]|uniref:uncharacterized protein LOC129761454 n=1 Tax=Toxorhynchites rutilus septentrionalis TaxID=329112 RepID=UPI00247A81F6|nr:uncharacterized protein LOC129761454 [Toxorhynchites rutilus septentrionalis]